MLKLYYKCRWQQMGVKLKQLLGSSARKLAYGGVSTVQNKYSCKLLIVGGGAGGCSIAWRLSRKLQNKQIIVLEPSQEHYYQPHFTLVAAGIKKFPTTHRPTASVLPRNVTWLRDHAEDFDPCNNVVYTTSGTRVKYDFMLVALGIQNDYDQIQGLKQALEDPLQPVTTNYAPQYCQKTWDLIRKFQGGLAVFTRPQKGGKCSGASHCATFLADDYWRKHKIRDRASITYVTGDEVSYGVKKYATALNNIAVDRNVTVNYNMELVEVTSRGAVFVQKGGGCIVLPYKFLHVTPHMHPPKCLSKCSELVTETGYLDVDNWTLQHRSFNNVFGIGDCMATPNSKTAAAVAQQSPIVERNLTSAMEGLKLTAKYNGYGACPIMTSFRTAILAEFLYDKQVWETFPCDQSKESRFLCKLKTEVVPYIYWNKLLKGKWNGPRVIRKIINPFGR